MFGKKSSLDDPGKYQTLRLQPQTFPNPGPAPSMKFADAQDFSYKDGYIFLGRDQHTGQDIGVKIEKHGIVVAASRTGKGAAFIIPNLRRWLHSVVIIDPKGENCVESWAQRRDMGQTIALLDPFETAQLPIGARDYFKNSFNPLEGLGPNTPRARENIADIANVLVTVDNKDHMEWVRGCRSLIAGAIAYTIAKVPPEQRTLGAVRGLLKQNDKDLTAVARLMTECEACGGLASAAGGLILKALKSDKGLPHQILDKARAETEWLDSPELSGTLSSSSFTLSDLVSNKLSVYLVLDPDDIETYSAYLRLFIQTMLRAITRHGVNSGCDCLFILDEFTSLGKFDKVAEVMSRMAGYGVHVVPIVTNIGSIHKLYGKENTDTFFGNADFKMFFGTDDPTTADYISARIGNFTLSEVTTTRPVEPIIASCIADYQSSKETMANYRASLAEHTTRMHYAGKPRLPASDIVQLVGKPDGHKVAKSMIVILNAGVFLNLELAPYFAENTQKQIKREEKPLSRFVEYGPLTLSLDMSKWKEGDIKRYCLVYAYKRYKYNWESFSETRSDARGWGFVFLNLVMIPALLLKWLKTIELSEIAYISIAIAAFSAGMLTYFLRDIMLYYSTEMDDVRRGGYELEIEIARF